jgi:hypothetical protein
MPTWIFPGLLAYRIWKIERNVSTSRASKVMTTSIMRVVMDSAILYTAALLATVTGSLCAGSGPFVLIDMVITDNKHDLNND